MKIKGLYIVACLALLSFMSCDQKDAEKAAEKAGLIEIKLLEREIVLNGYSNADTVIAIPDFSSSIKSIKCDAEWLEVEVQDTVPDKYQLKVVCYQNTTANIRSTQVVVTCENGDKLTLKVTQKVMGEFDDIHNVVTDQPSFAPVRSSTL